MTLAGALLLSGGEILAMLHGAATPVGTLSRLVLAAAVSYAAARVVLAVVAHYERRNHGDHGDRRPG